jgi:hypothetical protein
MEFCRFGKTLPVRFLATETARTLPESTRQRYAGSDEAEDWNTSSDEQKKRRDRGVESAGVELGLSSAKGLFLGILRPDQTPFAALDRCPACDS